MGGVARMSVESVTAVRDQLRGGLLGRVSEVLLDGPRRGVVTEDPAAVPEEIGQKLDGLLDAPDGLQDEGNRVPTVQGP